MDILKLLAACLERPLAVRSLGGLLSLLAAGGFFCPFVVAQSNQPAEYEVKAAFLFNFTKFVEWPEGTFDDAQAPIVFGIIGAGGRGGPWTGFQLRRVSATERVQGRRLVIRDERFGDDLRGCQVLFVGASERPHVAQILASVESAGVLTISDMDGFADAGGVAQIVADEDRIQFVVNLRAAAQSKLRLSAKLLALARVIKLNEAAK